MSSREYVLERLGHCDHCARVQGYKKGDGDPWARLPECDCAFMAVTRLFDKYEDASA